jgi:hypothetical protein
MAENRDRELKSRETTQRKTTWTVPTTLPDPAPEDGYSFRWIRTSIMGQFDPTNTSSKLREGWEPVKAEDKPEMMLYSDPNSRFKDNIENGGLMLCKMPTEMVQQRNSHYSNVSRSQIEAVDNSFMKSNDPRMPLFNERTSKVTFGSGSK